LRICKEYFNISVHVGHALARAEAERFELRGAQNMLQSLLVERRECSPHLVLGRVDQIEGTPMLLADLEKLPEVLSGLGPATNTQEVDELNKQACLASARLSHDVD
jgi:hypothetical protein